MNDPLLDLLGLATSRPSEALASYQRDDHHLHTIREAGETVALIGIRLTQDEATILQIAVAPAHQGKSLGRKMIDHVLEHHPVRLLRAETDRDAVGFYRTLGFRVTPLGEKYPGVERFICQLERPVLSGESSDC